MIQWGKKTKRWPKTIRFESNSLTNKTEIQKCIMQLQSQGYQLQKTGHDTIMTKPN